MDFIPNGSDAEWSHLVRVAWIVLIPVGVLLAMVLYKLAMLLHSLLEFVTLARYEMTPTMQDLRLTAEHVEAISRKAADGVQRLEDGVSATGPVLRTMKDRLADGAQTAFSTLKSVIFRR